MRISDWSSDLFSSDLGIAQGVAKTITDRLRNAPLISLGDRPNESLVDRLSDLEGLNMHILEWVARRRFASCGHNNCVRRCFSRISSFRRHAAQLSCCHRPFADHDRSEEHTSELQSLLRISYAVFCLENKKLHITPCPLPTSCLIFSYCH